MESNAFKRIYDDTEFIVAAALEIQTAVKHLKPGDYIYKARNVKIAIVKYRLENPDNNKGKSGGFRAISLIDDEKRLIFVLSLYTHSDKDNISVSEKDKVRKLCDEYCEG